MYTKECMSCDQHRQLIIFKQLCSNNRLANSVQLLIEYANLSYALSDPVIIYSSYIPIQNIVVLTRNELILSFTEIIERFLSRNYFSFTIE